MTATINSEHELLAKLNEHPACAFYFSQPQCGVCHALKPKLLDLFHDSFSQIPFYSIDASKTPAIAAQHQVFTVPTLLVFFEQSEMIRESRHISVPGLKDRLLRPYEMLFGLDL